MTNNLNQVRAWNAKAAKIMEDHPGAIVLKDWMFQESKRLKVTPQAVYNSWRRGKYPNLKTVVVNQRRIFVLP